MSSQVSTELGRRSTETPRRELNPRQAETVERLVRAALEELRAAGFEALTVRTVAARAEVAPATAYTYFSSKNHLVAETFWRRLSGRPMPAVAHGEPVDRVVAVFRDLADFLSGEPELSAAATTAMLGPEPDVRRLRTLVAGEIQRRLTDAYGDQADAAHLEVLALAWAGSMLQAGIGHSTYAQMGDQLARVSHTVMGRR
jgi:AcrR family transcriptional regulator